jgi:ABC-type transport system involved in multi-copper enzyme maturation permease subunit
MTSFLSTVATVFRKEMWEHFKTWRLIVIGGIFAFVFIVISLYGGILVGQGNTQLSFKAGANSVLALVLSFTGFFPGLMAIVISYTAIVGERSRKSLILLTSKPVKRPALFTGKFLSSYFAIVLVYMVVMTVGYIGVVAASGNVPSLEDVGRAYGAVAFVIFAMACWVVFAMFLSSLLKNPITVAVSAIMVWFLVMPIVSQIGTIYWLVTTNQEDNAPDGVGLNLIPQGGGDMVLLTGSTTTMYEIRNDTGPVQGIKLQSIYIMGNLPDGNYTWNARGGGIDRNGTLVIDGRAPFSVIFDGPLTVSVMQGINVTLEKDGRTVTPSADGGSGPFRNITYRGSIGNCHLKISKGDQVLFTGGYEITGRHGGGPFAAMATGSAPDYVKYNQLINPDSAMSGYEKVLDPDATSLISPAEGATALLIFFLVFLSLGLLVFSKMEMA